MKTLTLTRFLQSAVVLAAVAALGASDAQAGRGSFGGWGSAGGNGSWGSAGGHGSCGGRGSWGSFGGFGSHGGNGLFNRYGSRGSHGGNGSHGGYVTVNHNRYGSNGSTGGTYYSAPNNARYSTPSEERPAPEPPVPDTDTGVQTPAKLRLNVPADAQVFVNDQRTTSTGTERQYVARGLRDGETYQYRLRVEFTNGGEPVVENKLVKVHAGDVVELEFGRNEQLAMKKAANAPIPLAALN